MFKNLLLAGFLTFCPLAKAQFIATYSFELVTQVSGPSDPSYIPLVQGLTLGACKAVGVSLNSSASGRFAFTAWPQGGIDNQDDFSQFSGSLSGFSYYEFSLKVLPGYALDLNSIAFSMRRSGTGPRNYALRGSKDNFTSNLAALTGTNSKLSVLPGNIFFWKHDSVSISSDQKGSMILPPAAYQQMGDSATFRIYAWNSEASGGSFSIDNLTLSGVTYSITGIKEPENKLAESIFYNSFKKELHYSGLNIGEVLRITNLSGLQLSCKIERTEDLISLVEMAEGLYIAWYNSPGSARSFRFYVRDL